MAGTVPPVSEDLLALWIQPRSSRQQVAGERDGAVVIRLQAPPVDGAANQALRHFLADRLRVPLARVELVRGLTGRRKWVRVEGFAAARLREILLSTPDPS